jgi:microcystin-dependent protein
MSIPVNLTQPGLALSQMIIMNGLYPSQSGGGFINDGYGSIIIDGTAMGMIVTTAFTPNFSNFMKMAMPTNGASLPLWQNSALYSIIGPYFGPNSNSTTFYPQNFQVPSLNGGLTIGASPSAPIGTVTGNSNNAQIIDYAYLPSALGGSSLPITNKQYGTSVQYLIQAEGTFQPNNPMNSTIGLVVPFAGNIVPANFLQCNGQTVPISAYPQLYSLLGTTYGGDGVNTFALPNLTGRIPVGTGGNFSIGQIMGSDTITLIPSASGTESGSSAFLPVSTMGPSLALHFFINTTGIWGQVHSGQPTLGQIMMYAGTNPPSGWVQADGQLLSIQNNAALFSLLGNRFGGDGVTTFAVPDLRDRAILGTGGTNNLILGQAIGQLTLNVTTDNLPYIIVPPPGLALETDSGSSGSDHITNTSAIDVSGVWPQAQIEYSVDGVNWSATLQASEGKNTIYVRQIDYIGQASQASKALTFVLDTKAPGAPEVALNAGVLTNALGDAVGGAPTTSVGALKLSGIEKGAIVTYSIDGGTTWSEHFQAAPGLNSVQVRQTDTAGNVSAASAPFVFNYTGTAGQAAQYATSLLPDGGQRIDVSAPGTIPANAGTAKTDVVDFAFLDTLLLPSAVEDVVLSGLGAGNIVQGNSSANKITVSSGSWVIDGALGNDQVVVDGALSDYAITTSKVNGIAQTVLVGPSSKLVIKNVEEIEFKDGKLLQTSSQETQEITLLYKASFDRTPDWVGLQSWEKALTPGRAFSTVAEAFIASDEFVNRYGQAASAIEFVTSLYQNVLGRNPDMPGLSQWTLALDQRQMSRADVLVGIATSSEAKAAMPYSLFHLG